MRTLAALLAASALALLLAPGDAAAIPAFARKYRQSCTTCHAPFPRLKPYGEEFAARGFRMEEGAEPARATFDGGDELLSLPREFPLAVRFDAFVDWEQGRDVPVDFQAPFVFKALTGGAIADKVAYYTYFIIEDGGDVMGIEDAWVQFSEVLGLPVDVAVGQFQLCDPVVKREVRLTRLDYEIFKVTPGLTVNDLTYDRGLLVGWGAPAEVDVVAMVTNGNGIGPAADVFDSDQYKNVALRLARSFGPVRLGLFGQVGKALDPTAATREVNTHVYWGPDVMAELGPDLAVTAAWYSRHDSNAAFDPANTGETNTRGGFLEAVWLPQGPNGRWALTALYNRVDSDDLAAERESAALAASWLLRRNVRLGAEASYDWKADAVRVSAGTVLAY